MKTYNLIIDDSYPSGAALVVLILIFELLRNGIFSLQTAN